MEDVWEEYQPFLVILFTDLAFVKHFQFEIHSTVVDMEN